MLICFATVKCYIRMPMASFNCDNLYQVSQTITLILFYLNFQELNNGGLEETQITETLNSLKEFN